MSATGSTRDPRGLDNVLFWTTPARKRYYYCAGCIDEHFDPAPVVGKMFLDDLRDNVVRKD